MSAHQNSDAQSTRLCVSPESRHSAMLGNPFSGRPVVPKSGRMIMESLLTALFGLEGALFAVALAGAALWIIGSPQHVYYDIIAALIGFAGIVATRVILKQH